MRVSEKHTVLGDHVKHTDTMPFKYIHTTVINSGRAHTTQHRTQCTLWALTAAIILADATVTPPSLK